MDKTIMKRYIILLIFIFMSNTIHPMAVAAKQIAPYFCCVKPKISPIMARIGKYKCDKYVAELKKWLKGEGDPVCNLLYSRALFVNTKPEDAVAFIDELARVTDCPFVIEFDCTKNWDKRYAKMQETFNKALESYKRTGKTSIVHFSHVEAAIGNAIRENLSLYQESDKYRYDQSILTICSTEDSIEMLCRDIYARMEQLRVKDKYVYRRYEDFPSKVEEIEKYNHKAYMINVSVAVGLASAAVAGLYITFHHLKNQR